MLRALIPVTLFAALASGCYGEAAVAYPADPTMAYVSPGVSVVYDYDYPVFFADGFYWRWYGGSWYRSPYHNRGWAVAYNVPVGVRGIQRPWTYSHYRGGYVAHGGYHRGAVVHGGRHR
jgi:hypothetical protein